MIAAGSVSRRRIMSVDRNHHSDRHSDKRPG
jgi:hypothetical protein